MRAELRAGHDRRSLVVSVENDATGPVSVALPNAHVHVVLRTPDGAHVRQSFGSMLDAAGAWQTLQPGQRTELVVDMRKHYAGASGRFLVECQIPARDSKGRSETLTARGAVDLAVPDLPPRDA